MFHNMDGFSMKNYDETKRFSKQKVPEEERNEIIGEVMEAQKSNLKSAVAYSALISHDGCS